MYITEILAGFAAVAYATIGLLIIVAFFIDRKKK